MKKLIIGTMLVIGISLSVTGQTDPRQKGLEAITMEAIQGQLEFLASDWTEGRGTGERGMYLASDYVASMFKVFGAVPGGDPVPVRGRRGQQAAMDNPVRTYFQNFSLIEAAQAGPTSLTVSSGNHTITFDQNVDFVGGAAAITSTLEAPVVFVGYGIIDKENGIDDFAGVDVEGKVILRVTGFPGINDSESPMYSKIVKDDIATALSDINNKKRAALADKNVAAVLDVTPDSDIAKRWGILKDGINLSYNEGRTRRTNWTRMRLESPQAPVSTASITITERVANFILDNNGISLNDYITDAAQGKGRFKGASLTSTASVSTEVETNRVRVRNVVAMIEGKKRDEFVVVGAHIDHMGMEPGIIWNGADDNASGTIGVVMLAKAFAATGVKPEKTILFCAWTGEEKGLLGSAYFSQNLPMGNTDDYKFYLNFDMIGRDAANDTESNMAGMTFTNTYPKLEEWTKTNVNRYGINLDINYKGNPAPRGGSDYSAFTSINVPVIAWMAAFHPDYHNPSDHVSEINWEKMQNIIRLGFLQLWDAANNDLQ